MARLRYIALVVAAVAVLAVPALAEGARPAKGSFLNSSGRNGLYLVTTRYTIKTLSFFCDKTRYDVIDLVDIRRNGTFRFRGRADRYEHGGALMGTHYKVRLSGRFTSPTRVRIKRTLAGCGSGTVTARLRR